MMKKSLFAFGLVACLSVVASADVVFHYDIPGDTDASPAVIEVDAANLPMSAPMTIGMSDNTGGVASGGVGFDFGLTADVGMSNFAWSDTPFADLNNWFPDNTLPAPVVVSFSPTFDIPAGPNTFMAATVDLDIAALEIGTYEVSTGAFVIDAVGNQIPVDPSAGMITVNVIPEPATLALLAFGGFSALRRRR